MESVFKIILPDYKKEHIALVIENGEFALPSFKQESGIRFNTVAKLNTAISERWNIPVTVSRCITAGDNGTPPIFAMHNHDKSSTLPKDAEWISLGDVSAQTFAQTPDGKKVLDWTASEDEEEWRKIPWSSSNWFDEVSAWVEESVKKRGGRLLAPVSQERAWAISCVLKAETSLGTLFLKALPPFWGHEPLLADYFFKQFPEHSPEVVAIEPHKHWMLTKEWAGKPPDGGHDWQTVLHTLAEMQKRCLADKEALLELGCRDRRLELLPSLLEPVVGELQDDEKRKLYGVNQEEAAELTRRIKRLPELCAKLASFGIEETLLHGDLWGSNVIMRDELSGKSPVIFDWTDAAFTHPFFDIYMLTTAETDDAKRKEELQAHMNVWGAKYAPFVVQEALDCSMQVAPFYYVIAFRTVEINAPPCSRWELSYLLERFVRKILVGEA